MAGPTILLIFTPLGASGYAAPPSTASPYFIAAAQCSFGPHAGQVGHARTGAVAGQCDARTASAGEVAGT